MSTKNGICDSLSLGAAHELEKRLKKAGCPNSFLYDVISSPGNMLANAILRALAENILPLHLQPTEHEFTISVSETYSTKTFIDEFVIKHGKDEITFDYDSISDQLFSNHAIKAGKSYKVILYELKAERSIKDILLLTELCNISLLSARGLCLLWEQQKIQLPADSVFYAFDSYILDAEQKIPKEKPRYEVVEILSRKDDGDLEYNWGLREYDIDIENLLSPSTYNNHPDRKGKDFKPHYLPIYKEI